MSSGGITLESYQKYLEFLEESEPQFECIRNMIKFDSISRIGEFEEFITNSYISTKADGLADYHYILRDQSGTRLYFTVCDWSKKMVDKSVPEKLGDTLKESDMRTVEERKNGYILVEGFIEF